MMHPKTEDTPKFTAHLQQTGHLCHSYHFIPSVVLAEDGRPLTNTRWKREHYPKTDAGKRYINNDRTCVA